MRPLVKICGLTRPRDAELAVALGADLIGVVRTEGSPRRATLEQARAVFESVGRSAATVLVFRGVPLDQVLRESETCGARFVQLYGASSVDVERARSSGVRVLRVYDLREDACSLPVFDSEPEEESPVLLDVGGGGSGRRFDWSLLGAWAPRFTFIAGGIRPENVAELARHRPYGIDLSSGVEREPGVKDEDALRRLFERIQEIPW